VAVPTTAGTGSEATRNAVISEVGPTGFKRSFRDERLVAADAIVDPDLLAGLPPRLIASQGMDAVTQLLEAYVSHRASPFTDALALSGLEAARDGLLPWHAGGPRPEHSRALMAYAALLSGICLAHAGLGAVHGLAAPLGAHFPVPHGAACGALLVSATQVNVAALEERAPEHPALEKYAAAGRLLARLPAATPGPAARQALVDTLRLWGERLGIAGLGSLGVGTHDVPRLVAEARGSSMRTNPIELSDAELAQLVEAAL
jgi:alcohol dehydrogenase